MASRIPTPRFGYWIECALAAAAGAMVIAAFAPVPADAGIFGKKAPKEDFSAAHPPVAVHIPSGSDQRSVSPSQLAAGASAQCGAPLHVPSTHASSSVHASPSSHAPSIGAYTHSPATHVPRAAAHAPGGLSHTTPSQGSTGAPPSRPPSAEIDASRSLAASGSSSAPASRVAGSVEPPSRGEVGPAPQAAKPAKRQAPDPMPSSDDKTALNDLDGSFHAALASVELRLRQFDAELVQIAMASD